MEINTGVWNIYNEYLRLLGLGRINNTLHTFKVALLNFTYIPNVETQGYWGDVNSHELVAHSYPTGGVEIPLKSWLRDEVDGSTLWSAGQSDINLGEIVTVKYFVIYNDTATNKPLVCWSYINANESEVTGLRFRVMFQQGIYKIRSLHGS